MSTVKPRRVKPYSGFSKYTPDSLLLDAGAFFKDFKVGVDTYTTAKAAGKCLGATQKGGEFSTKSNIRRLEIDGVKTRTKGDTLIDGWECYIKATFIEMTKEMLMCSLGAADEKTAAVDGYDKITGRSTILDEDYIENITWVGCLLGEDKPVIIQVYNGFNENGLTMAVADKDNAKLEVQFFGNNAPDDYSSDNEIEPPFAIYRPTTLKVEPSQKTEGE